MSVDMLDMDDLTRGLRPFAQVTVVRRQFRVIFRNEHKRCTFGDSRSKRRILNHGLCERRYERNAPFDDALCASICWFVQFHRVLRRKFSR